MIKVYCDVCEGKGYIPRLPFEAESCPDCKGEGWTPLKMKSPEEIKIKIDDAKNNALFKQFHDGGASYLRWVLGKE